MVEGGVECGPNAIFSFAREGYQKTDLTLITSVHLLDSAVSGSCSPSIGNTVWDSANGHSPGESS
jgi:hypothetical protein